MRRSIPLLVLLLATASSCGQAPRRSDSAPSQPEALPSVQAVAPATADSAAMESRAVRAGAGPNVSPTAAPGVAFNYRYAFALAAPRVAELQERHAQMCEELTIARCRITGMHYQVLSPSDIEARLELKLDPASARQFGRRAVDAVIQAEGMLTENEISGVDVGTGIQRAGRDIAQLEAELQRIEARLAQRNLAGAERERLDYEAQRLRDQIAAVRANRETQQESLATTPMVFVYGSGDLVPGYQPPVGIGESLERAGEDLVEGGTKLLVLLIRLAPWLLGLALLLALALFVRRRWLAAKPKAEAPEAVA